MNRIHLTIAETMGTKKVVLMVISQQRAEKRGGRPKAFHSRPGLPLIFGRMGRSGIVTTSHRHYKGSRSNRRGFR
jgi:hypothetical protein